MTKIELERQLGNLKRSEADLEIEQIASDPEKYTQMVRHITRVQGQILLAEERELPVTQEQRDELDYLAKKAWRVDELLDAKDN